MSKILMNSFHKEFDRLGLALKDSDLAEAQAAYKAILKVTKRVSLNLADKTPPNCTRSQRLVRFE